MNPEQLADAEMLIRSLLRDTDGWEHDQISWRLNDGLAQGGFNAAIVYAHLIKRGETEYITPLSLLSHGHEALPILLEDANILRQEFLRELIWNFGGLAVPALLDTLARRPDEDGYDRFEARSLAAELLGRLGNRSDSALAGLIAVVRDQEADEFLRASAARALGDIGHATPEVVSALTEVLSSTTQDQSWLRETLTEALGTLAPEA